MGPLTHFLLGTMMASFFSFLASLEMLDRAEKARNFLWIGHFGNIVAVSLTTLVVAMLLLLALIHQPAF